MAINAIVQGDTRIWDITITDRNGLAVDITSDSVWFTMKTAISDPDGTSLPIVLGPVAAVLTDPTNGKCTITLTSDPATGTGGLNVQNYFYDFQWNDNSATPVVSTLELGTVSVIAQVTRTT